MRAGHVRIMTRSPHKFDLDHDCAVAAMLVYDRQNFQDGGMEGWFEPYLDGYRIALRGTAPNEGDWWAFIRDVINDCRALPITVEGLGTVPRGFYVLAERVFDDITSKINKRGTRTKPLYIVGHSLGAATALNVAALLVMAGYKVKAVRGYGCPRTGVLKPLVDAKVDVKLFRYGKDFVTHVAPWFDPHVPYTCIGKSRGRFSDHSSANYADGSCAHPNNREQVHIAPLPEPPVERFIGNERE